MEFVSRAYAEGRFLASGPKQPRTGGIVVMMAESPAAAEAFVAQDPFTIAGVAETRLTAFNPSNLHKALK